MVLTVPFDGFASACARLDLPREAWTQRVGARIRVTAADPLRSLLVRAETGQGIEMVRARLAKEGFAVQDGLWSSEAESEAGPSTSFWIAAVSYISHDHKPGLWVDALPHKPAAGEVVAAMYEEFRTAGEVQEMDLDTFIKALDPNVVILDPEEQELFVLRHRPC